MIQSIGKYDVLERLGQGSQGIVYRAMDNDLQRIVAIKVIEHSDGDEQVFSQSLRREAMLAAGLDHPHITTIFDFQVESNYSYIAMEFVPDSLQKLLAQNRNLPWQTAMAIVGQIASALQYAHDNGVVHRDIKPQNILMTDNGVVKVCDFGIARAFGAHTIGNASLVDGTPSYMAPEQWDSSSVNAKLDQYALGILLYEIIAGHPPFIADSMEALYIQHRNASVPPFPLELGVPAYVEQIITKATQKDPQDRYADISCFIDIDPSIDLDLATDTAEVDQPVSILQPSKLSQHCCLCSRLLSATFLLGGVCDEPGCETVICQSCWGIRRRRLCPAHVLYQSSTASTDSEDHKSADLSSTLSLATFPLIKSRILDGFISRMDQLRNIQTLDGIVLSNGYVRKSMSDGLRSSRDSDGHLRLRPSLNSNRAPRFSTVRYSFRVDPKLARTAFADLVIEIRVLEPETMNYELAGAKPVSVKTFAEMLEKDRLLALKSKHHLLLGIYAFCGWDDASQELLTSRDPQKRFLNPNISPALIGSDLDSIVWNSSDPIVSQLGHYFKSSFEDEVEDCRDTIKFRMSDSTVYLIRNLTEIDGFTPAVSERAVESLIKEGSFSLSEELGERFIVNKEVI